MAPWHGEALSGQAWQGPVGRDMGCKQPQASRAVFGDAISASLVGCGGATCAEVRHGMARWGMGCQQQVVLFQRVHPDAISIIG